MDTLSTPTNWPNPERPGVPMFPERDGIHMFHEEGREEKMVGIFWNALHQAWQRGKYDRTLGEFLEDVLRDWKYYGPVLTPTQLTELLAGERERCLAACEGAKVAVDGWGDPIDDGDADRNEGIDDAMAKIRNLGDAP